MRNIDGYELGLWRRISDGGNRIFNKVVDNISRTRGGSITSAVELGIVYCTNLYYQLKPEAQGPFADAANLVTAFSVVDFILRAAIGKGISEYVGRQVIRFDDWVDKQADEIRAESERYLEGKEKGKK